MGCGTSRSHLFDEGVTALGSRNPFHHKTVPAPPKLLTHSSEPSIANHPPVPVLQKIKTVGVNHRNNNETVSDSDSGPVWFGSPSFRVYVQSAPDDGAKTGDEQKGSVIGSHGGENLTCNREVFVWGDSNGKEVADRMHIRGGRFRKAFQVHRVAFWHGGPWHVGHPKATRKAVED